MPRKVAKKPRLALHLTPHESPLFASRHYAFLSR
ncbi:hypothetical protein M2350_001834 [Candidatus Fervidibacter sacchari]|uniref:Uncharacterized protein n=1 Tax=Candidatus Fervidibacter sacchari TaxID=1448929 RepID=A0ABT2EPQ4_9BACT|nr:hypothetical protein [Candidatus Fervidibacter sacchari]